MRFRNVVALAVVAVSVAACTRGSVPSDTSPGADPPSSSAGGSKTQQTDLATIQQLESQAKAIAVTTGCDASSQCRSAPVGSKACGGPRYYIPWCAKTTDSVALYRKLAEIVTAEQAYNKKYQIVSTCEFRVPPEVVASAGACTSK